ncbi:MAG: DUF4382 domain-containing protein, partial [Ramlibacter sp.]
IKDRQMNFKLTHGLLGGRIARGVAMLGAVAALVACGGGGGGSDSGEGTLRVALTDAPACGYENVWVTVEKVRVHKSASASDEDSGWSELTLSPARRVDLRTKTNGLLEELGTIPLPAGQYSQIRLVLASNSGSGDTALANAVKPTGSAVAALNTPSGQQSGLKLQAHFEVPAGQLADVVLDFDACRSVVKAGSSGQYQLKPVIAVMPRVVTGIQGFVATSLPLGSTTVAAQQDGATIRSTIPDGTGKFNIPFLPAGSYTLVIASDGHATAVITGVTTGTATTVINGTTTAIASPVSTMADVTGTVTLSALSGTTTVATPLTDATARALQALTGGPAIELGHQAVDSVLGNYSFRLPVGAPVKAAFVSATTPLSFLPDAPVASKYTIQVQSPGRATQEKPASISGGTSASVNFNYGL